MGSGNQRLSCSAAMQLRTYSGQLTSSVPASTPLGTKTFAPGCTEWWNRSRACSLPTAGESNLRAKRKCWILLRAGLAFANFLRTSATFLPDQRQVSVTEQADDDGDDRGGRPAERERTAHRFLWPEQA